MSTTTGEAQPTHARHRSNGEPSARRWLSYITAEEALANVFIVLTGGAFLTGLALMLGTSDFEIGLLGAIPFICQVIQLLSAYLVNE